MRIEQYFLMIDYSLWERLARKNKLKARGTLLMALPDKHQLKFNIHMDAKTLMEAIEKRFSGNRETKKVQKTLLKQQYENFIGSSSESLDQIHDRLQKLINLEEQSLDDLFNNLKIFEAEVKSFSSACTSTHNIAFVSSQTPDNTNDSVSVVTSVSATSAKIPISALPNQIDADDIEEIDLKWQMAMLTVRARRFLQRTGRNLEVNGPTSMGFDMSKVECYNCHMKGHFARECRYPKDTKRNGAAEPQRRNVPVETSTSNSLVSQCDGVGSYDWSFQADEEPTNYALMAFTSSSSSSSNNEVVSCSKACTKAYATLQSHYDKLIDDFRKSQFDVISYKTRLESVKAKLLVHQQNETVFEEDIKLLKLEVQLRDNALVVLRQKFEKAEQERDDLKLKLEKFQTSSKNLSQLLASQMNDKTRLGYNTQVFTHSMFDYDEFFTFKSDESLPPSPIYDRYQSGDGYHDVPLPYTRTFMPPKPDLVFHNAPNVNETILTAFNVELSPTKLDTDFFIQPVEQVKTPRPSVMTIKTSIPTANHKTTIPKLKSNGNCRNRKACFVCKSLYHLIIDYDFYEKKMTQTPVRNHAQRGNNQQNASMTILNAQRHVVPTVVLTKSKLVPITAARPVTAAISKLHVTRPRPAKPIFTKPHSPPRSHINHSPSLKASTFPPKVTAVKAPMVNSVKGNWGNLQHVLKDKGVIDSGCSRHMTGNMSYLSDFEELNGGYVAFLCISQMCDKRNTVLFTETECLVLCLEFKLPDENQVPLRVPSKKNMYNVDLKHIVSSGNLTCLFANATLDESNLWHRRLGPLNFKTMNKLVKGKFDGKVDEGFLVGYSVSSKAFRVFNSRTRIVQETLHTNFLENKPNVAGEETIQQYVLFPVWSSGSTNPHNTDSDAAFGGKEPKFEGRKPESEVYVSPSRYRNLSVEFEDFSDNNINEVNAADSIVPVVSDFLYGTIEEEVYVCQPPGFEDPDHPDKVYKEVKALYGLHQAPRVWYETLANYLLENGFQRRKIDQTLFIRSQKGLQVKQKPDGIFISHDKYVAEILRKFGLTDGKSNGTPIDIEKPLLKDPDGENVDVHIYRSMIRLLMYLTSSRPYIMFAVCACACFQVTPKLHIYMQ
nr:hypothetical protein [Tanacetum cinerariifolium]